MEKIVLRDVMARLATISKSSSRLDVFDGYVKMAPLRALAKELAREDVDWAGFDPNSGFNLTLLYGLTQAYRKMPIERKWAFFDGYFEYAEHWALTDSVAVTLKKVSIDEVKKLIERFIDSPYPYKRRFAFVMALIYLTPKEPLDWMFARINGTEDVYHVYMAIAWFLAECYIKRPKETIEYMDSSNLAPWIRSKTVSKIRDSYRVSEIDKQFVLRWRPRA